MPKPPRPEWLLAIMLGISAFAAAFTLVPNAAGAVVFFFLLPMGLNYFLPPALANLRLAENIFALAPYLVYLAVCIYALRAKTRLHRTAGLFLLGVVVALSMYGCEQMLAQDGH